MLFLPIHQEGREKTTIKMFSVPPHTSWKAFTILLWIFFQHVFFVVEKRHYKVCIHCCKYMQSCQTCDLTIYTTKMLIPKCTHVRKPKQAVGLQFITVLSRQLFTLFMHLKLQKKSVALKFKNEFMNKAFYSKVPFVGHFYRRY